MNKRAIRWVPLVVAALFALGADEGSGCHCSTAKITGATLARGYDEPSGKAVEPTSMFEQGDQVFHLVVTTSMVPAGTKVGAEWWAVEAAGQKDVKIDSATLEMASTGVAHFTLSKPDPWPPGKYKVILSLDGKVNRTLEFGVKP